MDLGDKESCLLAPHWSQPRSSKERVIVCHSPSSSDSQVAKTLRFRVRMASSRINSN